MLNVEFRPRQKFSMQTGGSSVTRRFRSLGKSNIFFLSSLTAELLKVAPEEYLIAMLDVFNSVLRTEEIPPSWKLTLFTMLPKKLHSIQTSDFRPIANIRLFYKEFAYMFLARIENSLELGQPEEQHGFRPGRKIEEHLLTTNILLDKATAAGRTIWIVSLDLSKAFDRVHWPALWAALHDQGVSEHCI